MELADYPRKVLSYIGCVVSGFLFAIWCMPLFANKPKVNDTKEGFSIRLPMSHVLNLNEVSSLRGKQVRIVKRESESKLWCIVDHPPLTLNLLEQSIVLSSTMNFFDAIPIKVGASDLQSFKLMTAISSREDTVGGEWKWCVSHARVLYGDH